MNLHISPEYRIAINTNTNVLDDISTSVNDNTLTYKLSGRHGNIARLDFDIYAPEYSSILLDGVADIRCKEMISTSSFYVRQDGVGKIFLADIDTEQAIFNLDAVGDVEVKGTVDKIIVDHDGVGDLHLFDL